MKSQKGITLISVTVYILVMAIVIGIIASVTSFFYNNVVNSENVGENAKEFNKFNMVFVQEVNTKGNKIQEINEDEKTITFTSGNIYTYKNNCIYQNDIKVCENVTDFSLKTEKQYNKDVISVYIVIGKNNEFQKTTSYVITNE